MPPSPALWPPESRCSGRASADEGLGTRRQRSLTREDSERVPTSGELKGVSGRCLPRTSTEPAAVFVRSPATAATSCDGATGRQESRGMRAPCPPRQHACCSPRCARAVRGQVSRPRAPFSICRKKHSITSLFVFRCPRAAQVCGSAWRWRTGSRTRGSWSSPSGSSNRSTPMKRCCTAAWIPGSNTPLNKKRSRWAPPQH